MPSRLPDDPTPRDDARLTRRRALALGAAAGIGTLVRFPGAADAAGRTVSGVLDVPASAWGAGGRTRVLRAPRRFSLVGVRGRGLADAGLELRVREAAGPWRPWTPLGTGTEHAPDHPRRPGASDPVWAGGADELQLRARRVPGALRAHLVTVPQPHPGTRAALRAARTQATQPGGPPPIITRAQWGGDGVPPRAAPLYGDVQLAFVHHTVSANDYAAADSPGIVLAICHYHRDTNGWNDIGYNLLVDQFGQVFEGRAGGLDRAVVGAQAQGWNSHSTGIATIGTFSDLPFPEAGVAMLARTIAWKLGLHGVPVTGAVSVVSAGGADDRYASGVPVTFQRISGHRDGCGTSCPGDRLYAQLPALRERAAGLSGVVAAAPKLTVAAESVEVAYGQDATFAGTLRDGAGVPLAGVPVALQKQGSSAYVAVGSGTRTAADGGWSITIPWRRAAAVRAVAAAPGERVRSAAVTVGVTPQLTADALGPRVLAGRTVRARGRVRPGGTAPVLVLVERQLAGGRWTRVADVRATVSGTRWSAGVRLATPGLYRLTPRTGPATKVVATRQLVVRAVRRPDDVSGLPQAGGAGKPVTVAPISPAAAGGAAAG